MRWALRNEALGMGDIKFFAVAGLWLGFWSFPVFLILSGVFGVSVGLTFKIWKREVLFPFGPALVLSLLFCVLFL
jgi:prepilin signal peptidase PulO-like enzyme (type II secretory pathway)